MSYLSEPEFPCQSCGKLTTRGILPWKVHKYQDGSDSHWNNSILTLCSPDCGEDYATRIHIVCPRLTLLRVEALRTVRSAKNVKRDLRVHALSKRDAEAMATRFMVGEWGCYGPSVRIVRAGQIYPVTRCSWGSWEEFQL